MNKQPTLMIKIVKKKILSLIINGLHSIIKVRISYSYVSTPE